MVSQLAESDNNFGLQPQLSGPELMGIAAQLHINPSPTNLRRIQNGNMMRYLNQYLVMPFVREGYEVYTVFSQKLGGRGYIVTHNQRGGWTCGCDDFNDPRRKRQACKHILTIKPKPIRG